MTETDYLIVGSGAVGLAFADTLLAEDAHAQLTIVDRHGRPGGHWNDAYAFVTLHQPSAFYGVNSLALGSGRIDADGPNRGFHELATGAEVSAYFERVMRERLLPSGRVRYLPMSDHAGAAEGGAQRIVSLLSGRATEVRVRRRVVDATYYGTTVPSTHQPRFAVGEGVRLVPPNALPDLGRGGEVAARRYVVLGAGKTGMDVVIWLLGNGAEAEDIQWVVPRDSWLVNRRGTQPSAEFFEHSIGGQVLQMEALAQATDAASLFERLEAGGVMLRIDRDRSPTMFHYATVSEGEVQILRRVRDVIRLGRVQALHADRIVLEQGEVPVPPGTLFIDCTATAVTRRPPVPLFQPGRIVLQMVRIPQPAFSAALAGWVEAHGGDDDERNALCAPIPLPDGIESYPLATLVNLLNQQRWGRLPALREWIRGSRLDGFGQLIAGVDAADTARMAWLARLKAAGPAVAAAAPRWLAAGAA